MTPAEFQKRRARIDFADKPPSWQRRAMAALVREARAVLVVNARHVIGWQMLNGQVVCVKQRYRTQELAEDYLRMIRECRGGEVKPQRAYHCPHCAGWHLTSKPSD